MVEIKNNKLKLYIETVLNKNIKDITKEELEKIEILSFECENNSKNHEIDLSDIIHFPNINKVVISDSLVTLDNIISLQQAGINKLRLNRCALTDDNYLSKLDNISSLELINNYNKKYDFLTKLTNLETLAVVRPYTEEPINLKMIENINNLKNVTFQFCILDNVESFSKCNNIESLNVLSSDLPNVSSDIFNNMNSLKELFISKHQNIKGIREDIKVRNNLIDFLFDPEENHPEEDITLKTK